MYDINFFKKSNNLKNKITSGLLKNADTEDIGVELESLRKKSPNIYNIETTNYCNMKCVMCPRTMFMTRKNCLLYTSPSPRDRQKSRMPSSA